MIISVISVMNSVIPVMNRVVSLETHTGFRIHHGITNERFGKVKGVINAYLIMYGSLENKEKSCDKDILLRLARSNHCREGKINSVMYYSYTYRRSLFERKIYCRLTDIARQYLIKRGMCHKSKPSTATKRIAAKKLVTRNGQSNQYKEDKEVHQSTKHCE